MGAHGKIVEKAEVTITPKKSLTNSNKADDSSSVPPASGKDKDKTTAEAVIVKIWTPSSKLLNLGKIRKVQRKTNTVIRRKKLRFTEKIASIHGGANLVSEKIEEELEEDSGLGNDDDGEDEMPIKEVSIAGESTELKLALCGSHDFCGIQFILNEDDLNLHLMVFSSTRNLFLMQAPKLQQNISSPAGPKA